MPAPEIGVPSSTTPILRTYLDLTRRLAQEVGVSKDPVTSIPTLAGATGETKRLMDWICTAWRNIQNLHTDWRFLRRPMSFTTIDGQATYTQTQVGLADGTLGSIDRGSFRSFLTTAGQSAEVFMEWMDFDEWYDTYQFSSLRTTKTMPIYITETFDGLIGLGPVPLAGYTVNGHYYLAPTDLLADSDVPTLPPKHDRMIIVYKAMEDHGYFEAATDVLVRGQSRYKALLNQLEREQLKQIHGPGALA